MISKACNSVIGIAMTFMILNASAETNRAVSGVTEPGIIPAEKMAPEKPDRFDFIVGGGLLIAPEYGDYLDEIYNPGTGYINTDNFAGWIDLYLGLEFRPVEQFGIILGGDLWFNGGVEVSGGTLAESYANFIVLPSIYGQFYFTKSRTFYIKGGINFPVPETGSQYFEFKSNGVGFGVHVGVELADLIRIEGGYVSVPVTVEATDSNPLFNEIKDYDFGGAQIRLLFAF